ncbi:unnamed protein product [Phytophthora lilii]|uniref:Unnamed protein product n=1 Tax=Phytophthora lilii TaxID=2077276 RepID=A0A9W6U9T2_9STRA|nr:unnamed protein product [Phytophthora lilii]
MAAADSVTREQTYVLVSTSSLPIADLSKSIRAEFLPQNVDGAIFDAHKKFHKPLLFGAMLALWLNVVVTVVKASIGQYLALVSALVGFLLTARSFTTLDTKSFDW